jgi:hypothetical protein
MKQFFAKVWEGIKKFFVSLSTVVREGGKPGDPVSSRRVAGLGFAGALVYLLVKALDKLPGLANPWPLLVLLGIPAALVILLFYFTTLGDIKSVTDDVLDRLGKKGRGEPPAP